MNEIAYASDLPWWPKRCPELNRLGLSGFMPSLRGWLACVLCVLGQTVAAGGEWTTGFESAEGYEEGRGVRSSRVSVLGGEASVLVGDAAEGEQFLRFVPNLPQNALVLNMGRDNSAGGERAITFAFRLVGENLDSRLVLSYGQTVEIRPIVDGVEIDTAGSPFNQVHVLVDPEVWLRVGFYENASTGRWDLYVDEQVMLTDLEMQSPSELMADLLIFADGALDLDAVVVSATQSDTLVNFSGNNRGSSGSQNLNNGDRLSGESSEDDSARVENQRLGKALVSARKGNFAESIGYVVSTVPENTDLAAWNYNVARRLASVAFSLRDSGRAIQATVLAQQALRQFEWAHDESGNDAADAQANYAFIAGQLWEDVIVNYAKSEMSYRRSLAFDESHPQAFEAAEKISRKRSPGPSGPDGS